MNTSPTRTLYLDDSYNRAHVRFQYNVRFSIAQNKISTYTNNVEAKFLELFDLRFIKNLIYYQSYADIRKLETNPIIDFACLEDACTPPLTRVDLRNSFINDSSVVSGSEIQTRVLWTGHILDGNPGSVSSGTAVIITPHHTTDSSNNYINRSDDEVQRQSERTLFHELSHQLGAHDHYCYDENGATCDNNYCYKHALDLPTVQDCVMGRFIYLDDPDLLCTECSDIISNHLSDHH